MRSAIKLFTAGVALCMVAIGIGPAAAGYPDRPVKIVVPFAPAGPTRKRPERPPPADRATPWVGTLGAPP